MNTGVYGSHYENGAIYMSLIRGATYCAHPIGDRPLLPQGRFIKKIDQGESVFSFRLSALDAASLERRTQEFVQKPYALNIFPIKSAHCKLSDFDVSLDDKTVSLVTMKKADGKDAVIFRLLNNSENDVVTVLNVNSKKIRLSFGRYEVKTIIYADGKLSENSEIIL